MLKDIIKARFKHIIDLFDLTGEIDHTVEKGGFREYFISQLIRPLIPNHFGIGTGIIMDHSGKQSPQIDLLIYDRRTLQPIFEADNRGIYPIDSVIAVIEIKTKLTAGDLRNLQKTALCFLPGDHKESLYIATPGNKTDPKKSGMFLTTYPMYSIFAYTSDADKPDDQRIKEQCDKVAWRGYRLIGVADKGIWHFNDDQNDFERINYNQGDFIIKYLHQLLSELENTAKSRGDFGLQFWI